MNWRTALGSLFGSPRADSTTLRSPATWFVDWLNGHESAAGVQVSESSAMNLSAYYCGLNMIAGTIGSLPLNVYQRNGNKRNVADTHPAHGLLHAEPNPEMTAMSMRQTWVLNAIARGNAYGEIERDNRGQPMALWPISPTLVTPKRDTDGRLWYEVRVEQDSGMETRYIRREDMLHIPGLGFDGVVGYGLITVAREAIGLNVAQDQYAGKFFRNGGNISGVVESPTPLKDETFDRLKKEITAKFSGLTNAHRIAILENGLKFNAINPTHQEAQLVESRRFSVEEWARWLNMPPHKLKEMTHATFSNIEHQNIEWVVDTIRPWLVRFEQEYNRKLFRKTNQFYCKHVVDGLLRGDQKARYDAYAVGRNWGWLSVNDVLELEDRNPLPENIGDVYLIPSNMQRVDQPLSAEKQSAEKVIDEETDALRKRGTSATYNNDFRQRVMNLMGVSPDAAAQYARVAAQLNLLADDQDIPPETLRAAKVQMLMDLSQRTKDHAQN